MGYLLAVSFVLHFITFYLLIMFYQRLKAQQPFDKEKTLREMEDLLIAYTQEMKDNNEKLAKTVLRERKAKSSFSPPISKDITEAKIVQNDENMKEDQENILEQKHKVQDEKVETEHFQEQVMNYTPPLPKDEPPPLHTSPISQILSLHKRGLDVNEIAKQLNMGAGEVELLIKIHK